MPITASDKELIIYESKDGKMKLSVNVDGETIWLPQQDIASLFDVNVPAVSKHIKHIYEEGELKEKGTLSKMETVRKEGKRSVRREVESYSLDMILSIGYRVNSKRATQFRIWASQVLKQHLLKGYTINRSRLESARHDELKAAVNLIKQTIERKQLSGDESEGLLKVITDYAHTWSMLDQFDREELTAPKSQRGSRFKFAYEDVQSIVRALKKNLVRRREASDLFGREKGDSVQRILGALEQTFDQEELYDSIETKAAHLLYFMIKDHPFVDGNKRIAAFLFVVYLTRTKYLSDYDGERKFNDNALVALVLLVAESNPKHKDLMIKLIMNFVHG
ncbi:Fic/DOC family protein [Candidatus Peribacteria bacterium]|nr:Fic/DOC family protein [Candidatus Peribacteria bacterium]